MAMANPNHKLIVCLLPSILILLLSSIQFTQAVEYVVRNSAPTTAGGKRFETEIRKSHASQTLSAATGFISKIFKQTATERKNIQKVTLIVESFNGVAFTSNDEIHLSASYIAGLAAGTAEKEIAGVLYHEMTHVWQWNGKGHAPGGLIEGIADFVRLRAGYAPAHWVKPGEGSSWDKGYDVTARFLDYCDGRVKKEFVANLNKKLRDGYSPNFFVQLLGKKADQLWKEYKARYNRS